MTSRLLKRYENKFELDKIFYNEIINYIKKLPLNCQEIFQERVVNSIYLDSIDHDSYKESVEGHTKRRKIRLRWYGENMEIYPVLELKSKYANIGDKFKVNLDRINLNDRFINKSIHNSIERYREKILPIIPDIYLLKPNLYCSYKRRYFLSFDRKVRFTIDKDIIYKRINPYKSIDETKAIYENSIVVEVKYSSKIIIRNINNRFFMPVAQSRFSKYTNGFSLTNYC